MVTREAVEHFFPERLPLTDGTVLRFAGIDQNYTGLVWLIHYGDRARSVNFCVRRDAEDFPWTENRWAQIRADAEQAA